LPRGANPRRREEEGNNNKKESQPKVPTKTGENYTGIYAKPYVASSDRMQGKSGTKTNSQQRNGKGEEQRAE